MNSQPQRTGRGQMARTLRGSFRRFAGHGDELDCRLQEDRDANLLHGELGRDILGDYEDDRQQQWSLRAVLVFFVAVLCGLAGVLLHLPQPVMLILFGVPMAVAGVCFAIGFGHALRWVYIAYRPTPPNLPSTSISPQAVQDGGQAIESNLHASEPPGATGSDTAAARPGVGAIQALQPQDFHERAYWWNLNAVQRFSITSPLTPEACRAALTTIIQPATAGWYEASQRLVLGSPLRKREVQVTVKQDSFSLDSEWRPGMSTIRDGLVLTGSLQPSPRGGSNIPIEVAGHSTRLIASAGVLPVFVLLVVAAVTGYPSQGLMTFLAVGLLVLWAYGYFVASASVGADAQFLVAALRQAVQAPDDDGAAPELERADRRGDSVPPATGSKSGSAQ